MNDVNKARFPVGTEETGFLRKGTVHEHNYDLLKKQTKKRIGRQHRLCYIEGKEEINTRTENRRIYDQRTCAKKSNGIG